MSELENSAGAAAAQSGSIEQPEVAAPSVDKGKGKAKAVEPMEEDDDDDEDSSDEELAEDDDEEDENPLEGLDLDQIMPNARAGRKTRTQVDYASQEALANAGLAQGEEPIASDDEEDEFKADESMDE
ncbi:hypothetical protein FA09DRAFT_331920 [Tilletiopsis washingtonensis]|uniref:Histone chaperone domain-containing protein n=1 Tax=Tilletiopsis washingtonensis TaxID=58919 RepID=A0A316Z241_9BASI|nr:hypothetical protein FA09DRAFT_331920 [Tilletiopsis washingtonensis]PWN95601.1 hypothetical protein FA09DRAFT_331920 [Tilletiopsis washingtonensis]